MNIKMNCQKPNSFILTWESITAWTKQVEKAEGRKKLLSGVSGIAKSGVLTAILSPSGAGKTTLLAILSKRYKAQVSGEVMVNGCALCEEEMSRICGYVCQKDQNHQDLTVYEHLIFMARLKMDKSISPESCHETILRVTKSLILSHKMYVTISSLSGGQKKRLSLAVQLLTEPKILFCDEPTTGLDSYSAEQVVKLLRAIANDGKMVICSIHQPASGIFELFDDVSLLASGGKLAYHGPVSSIHSFFSGLNAICPKNFNLSEFIVSQVTVKNVSRHAQEDDTYRVLHIVDCFLQSEVFERLMDDIRKVKKETLALQSHIKMSKRESTTFRTEFSCLFWRIVLRNKNSFKITFINFSFNAFLFCFIGLLYRGSFGEDQKSVQNITGYLYFVSVQLSYATLNLVLQELPEEVPIAVLEIADRVYSPLSLYLSKAAFLTCSMAVQNIIFMLLTYWASGLRQTLVDFLMIGIITVLLSAVSAAYGIFLSTAFRSVQTSTLFSIPFEFINRLFCGIQIRLNSLPWFLAILKYTSFQYFSFEGLNIIEWSKFDHLKCNSASKIPCFKSGNEVLSSMGLKRDHLPVDIIGLILCSFFWHSLAFGFLIRKLKRIATY